MPPAPVLSNEALALQRKHVPGNARRQEFTGGCVVKDGRDGEIARDNAEIGR